jgi:hypothetical protein
VDYEGWAQIYSYISRVRLEHHLGSWG